MAISKELALAIDFKKAPKELQQFANDHYTNLKEIAKLKQLLNEAAAALDEAEKKAAQSEVSFNNSMRSWEPEIDGAATIKDKVSK